MSIDLVSILFVFKFLYYSMGIILYFVKRFFLIFGYSMNVFK